jgi:hypothetical protein
MLTRGAQILFVRAWHGGPKVALFPMSKALVQPGILDRFAIRAFRDGRILDLKIVSAAASKKRQPPPWKNLSPSKKPVAFGEFHMISNSALSPSGVCNPSKSNPSHYSRSITSRELVSVDHKGQVRQEWKAP